MARSTVHYADKETNNILKKLHNKLRPAGTPVQRVEYIIELLLLRIFEVKLAQDPEFEQLRAAFAGDNEVLLFSSLLSLPNDQILPTLNSRFFPFYARVLSEARKVWKGNLSTKVQDQLVLIEEVFGNSNFTNNVTSGNMAEVIGLVAELDSERLLKTDLLGDAIESALSETGGTKDIGLHRTPTFQSRLFDPAVGTGGFMFDSFEYVLEGIYREGHWPGPKTHPELASWFKQWFDDHPVEVPSLEVTTDFYRTGVGGIEYLGMVRKMAAETTFWHMIQEGDVEDDRTPDFRRCERIRWPRPVIEHNDDSAIKIWRNQRGNEVRVCLWFAQENYLVILADRGDYILPWTAYLVEQPHRQRKLQREYEEYCKRERQNVAEAAPRAASLLLPHMVDELYTLSASNNWNSRLRLVLVVDPFG